MAVETHLPDVSEFQPVIDWNTVANHNGGAAIIRASYASYHLDHAWYNGARRTDAHDKGIRALGIYHYLTAVDDVAAQAKFFIGIVGSLQPGEFSIIDHEEGNGDQLARAEEFLNLIDQALTYPGYHGGWHYSGDVFYHDHNLMPIANSNRHTWVAAYGQGEPTDVPHSLWQHSSAEDWPGIGACDCSIFHGDVAALESLIWTPPNGKIQPAPAPQPVVHVPTPSGPVNRPEPPSTVQEDDDMRIFTQLDGGGALLPYGHGYRAISGAEFTALVHGKVPVVHLNDVDYKVLRSLIVK